MSSFGEDNHSDSNSADAEAGPTGSRGPGRLPRLQPFDIATFRDEPRPALVPPLAMPQGESLSFRDWRETPANVRLPSCGEVILGPSEQPSRVAPASARQTPSPVMPSSTGFRPTLWAAGVVAVMIAAVPIVVLQLASGKLGGIGNLLEGRSSSDSSVSLRTVPMDDGVPLITADPRPFKRAVPAGEAP